MKRLTRSILVCWPLVTACSATAQDPGGDAGASGTEAGIAGAVGIAGGAGAAGLAGTTWAAGSAGAGNITCEVPAPIVLPVVVETLWGSIPYPAGGVLADGVYDLLESGDFDANRDPYGDVYSATLVISDNVTSLSYGAHRYDELNRPLAVTGYRAAVVSKDATSLSLVRICPDTGEATFSYTVTEDDRIFVHEGTKLHIYGRRPE